MKNILKKKSATSAPGEDGLLYGVLKNLPSTHHFLDTEYNKIDESETAPDIFAKSNIILIHKRGDDSDASNIRMIALP